MPFVPLNWKELELQIESMRPVCEGLFVDRIVVPERREFSLGFVRGEWAIRLVGRKQEISIIFSVRPKAPYFYISHSTSGSNRGPKSAEKGTHSPFSLGLNRQLKGCRLLKLESLEKERICIFRFSPSGDSESAPDQTRLVLWMVPSNPEALLIDEKGLILARTRMKRTETHFTLPAPGAPPANPLIREKLGALLGEQVELALRAEAFEQRLASARKQLQDRLKQADERSRQCKKAAEEAQKEKDWQHLGDLLKSSLSGGGNLERPESDDSVGSARVVLDYTTGESVQVPCDPKLSIREQVEKYYALAKRKKRRIGEALARAKTFDLIAAQLESQLAKEIEKLDWQSLEKLELITYGTSGVRAAGDKKQNEKRKNTWLGRSFASIDGMTIWVGKSKDENLELTFKNARGNDLWMHLRGRPGAHVVIPLQPGKSPSLETLLDAAALTIHYSGGGNWGKTEVDYTFKKYVKRIRDSTEASYTNNKTLIVEPDEKRIKRLTSQIS